MVMASNLQWSGPTAIRSDGTIYRVVFNHGFYCLRHEVEGKFKWLGQYPTLRQASTAAAKHDLGLRRLKAWEQYMMAHDPPSAFEDPDWNPDDGHGVVPGES